MPLEVLLDILDGLPEGCSLQPNSVGQVIVITQDEEVLGYIDFERGKLVRNDDV